MSKKCGKIPKIVFVYVYLPIFEMVENEVCDMYVTCLEQLANKSKKWAIIMTIMTSQIYTNEALFDIFTNAFSGTHVTGSLLPSSLSLHIVYTCLDTLYR